MITIQFRHRQYGEGRETVYTARWPAVPRVGESVSIPAAVGASEGRLSAFVVSAVHWQQRVEALYGPAGLYYHEIVGELIVGVTLVSPASEGPS